MAAVSPAQPVPTMTTFSMGREIKGIGAAGPSSGELRVEG
jgi:hypothetical protein